MQNDKIVISRSELTPTVTVSAMSSDALKLVFIIISLSTPITARPKFKQKKIQTKERDGMLRTMLKKNHVYVDKTALILQLINSPDHFYFISRPRMFGKSLLLDTIKEIFLGNRELFAGRHIYDKHNWSTYPVLSFNFSTPDKKPNAKLLRIELETVIQRFANANNVSDEGANFQERLRHVLQHAHNVVVLVDEYDFPILHNGEDPNTAEQCRQMLKDFFLALENARIRFMLVTGVSLTTLPSIWKDADKLVDITTNSRYSTLLGFTENEYKANYESHIRKFVKHKNLRENFIHDNIKLQYNGYRFSKDNVTVFNPHSVSECLYAMNITNFWMQLGFPAFLLKTMWWRHYEAISLLLTSTTDFKTVEQRYNDSDKVPLTTLLFQTGHLTIRDYDPATNVCELDFPNEEVREAYLKCLMREFGAYGYEKGLAQRIRVRDNLERVQIPQFIDNLQLEYHRMLGIITMLDKTETFGFIIRAVLGLCTTKSIEIKDVPLAAGRYDFVSTLPEVFYVFEVQTEAGANFTLSLAEINEYRRKYSGGCTKTVAVSVTFNPTSCLLDKWRATVYEDGATVTELDALTPTEMGTEEYYYPDLSLYDDETER